MITESDLVDLTSVEKNEALTYFDGLGRSVQQVQWQASPGEEDQVAPMAYDEQGRVERQYLPFVSGNDAYFKPSATSTAVAYYDGSNANQGIPTDSEPYATTVYEASPLDRAHQQGAPGAAFQPATGRTTEYQYFVNDAIDYQAKKWTLDANGFPTGNDLYDDGELQVVVTQDEDDRVSEVYTDKLSQTVLYRVYNGSEPLDTYYLYDEYDDLRVVLSPEASAKPALSQNDMDQLAFQYKFDERGNMTQKKVPGAEWQYMLYDKRDRLILSQDGRQRQEGEWLFTHYDALDRPVVEGLYSSSNTYAQMLTEVNAHLATNLTNNAIPVGKDELTRLHGTPTLELDTYGGQSRITATQSITLQQGFEVDFQSDGPVHIKAPDTGPTSNNGAFPALANSEVLKIHHYDHYDFNVNGTADYAYDPEGTPADASINWYAEVHGRPTGTTVRVLNQDNWLTTVLFYDDRGRVIQTQSENFVGGRDRTTTEYSFHGLVLRQWHHQTTDADRGNEDLMVLTKHEYDHADRLTHVYQKVGNADEQLLAFYEYNELGQLIDKGLHEVSPNQYCQSVDFRYTIRGWLESINQDNLGEQQITGTAVSPAASDLFGQELQYNELVAGLPNQQAQYNGNISAVTWNSSKLPEPKAYAYTYDAVNRLTGADHSSGSNWGVTPDYDVSNISYDKNGNIGSLQRNGDDGSVMDDLTYSYQGNQLSGVEDAGSTTAGFADGSVDPQQYEYDDSGNLIEDINKDIGEVIYNHLNLPEEVRFLDGNKITYAYDATGTKLRQTVEGSTLSQTDYASGRHYQDGATGFAGARRRANQV